MALTLFVSSVFLAVVASARPIAVDGRASSFPRAGTPLDFKRVRSDSFAVRALSSVQPALARRLDGTPIRLALSPHEFSKDLLNSLDLGSDALRALVPLDGGVILDDAALNALLSRAGISSTSLNALEGAVLKTPELLSKNTTLPIQSEASIAVPIGAAPLLFNLTASFALFALISVGLWARTILHRVLHPEVCHGKIPFEVDTKEFVVERAGDKEKVLLSWAMEQTGLGLTFPREKTMSIGLPEKTALRPTRYEHTDPPPSYHSTLLTPVLAPVRASALRGFTTSLLPPLEIDEPAAPAVPSVLLTIVPPALAVEYNDPPTPILPVHVSDDPPTPTLPGNLELPSVPTHAPAAVTTRPEGAAVLRALLSVADVGDPAWVLRVLVLMLGWAFAAAAPVAEAHPFPHPSEPARVQEHERRVAVLA